jgi:ribosomal protein L44E
MKTYLSVMKKRGSVIPEETVGVFEEIVKKYSVENKGSNEGDNKFMEAIGEHLTKEQRVWLWEQCGGCKGAGRDKERKAFAAENADKPLRERLERYIDKFGNGFGGKTRDIVLDEENKTITVTFACDECYNRTLDGKATAPFTLYYESCAGGRMYGLEKALGIKLRIKSADIPPQGVSRENPCVYTFAFAE